MVHILQHEGQFSCYVYGGGVGENCATWKNVYRNMHYYRAVYIYTKSSTVYKINGQTLWCTEHQISTRAYGVKTVPTVRLMYIQ